jgi:Flp pilus assembly pilin Flp
MKSKIKGVSVLEYTILIAVILAAMLAMSIYLKRAITGKWKDSADAIGYGRQY